MINNGMIPSICAFVFISQNVSFFFLRLLMANLRFDLLPTTAFFFRLVTYGAIDSGR